MNEAHAAVDSTIAEIDRLKRVINRSAGAQIRASEERAIAKATALSWFNERREKVLSATDIEALRDVDDQFRSLISATDRASARRTYLDILSAVRSSLANLRLQTLISTAAHFSQTADTPPDFGKLVGEPAMREVLQRRWNECARCITAGVPLAAIVMIGGLVEALLLARVNVERDKSPIFKAVAAPKDKSTGKTIPLSGWTLKHYIDVAHELKWISQSARDVGAVMRDYRNYVHPFKEVSHGVVIHDDDAKLFWEISKSITRQLLS
ncbi:MAG: hypothetical protein H8J66_00065 [Nitrospira sp.]|nr:hypothetical protein [Nitrospira sp.]